MVKPSRSVADRIERVQLRSDDLEGRYLVLYFYPKANTSGCTLEAQDFTARTADFEQLGATVIGVSPDSTRALCRFIESKELGITLATDPERELARAFDTLKPDGKGILRSTFLIDRAGVLRHAWRNVKVAGHVDEVLELLGLLHASDQAINSVIDVRHSRRALSEEPIPRESLERLVEAATLAPSCSNNQPWRMIVATDERLEQVKGALSKGNGWARRSPAIVVFAAEREADCTPGAGRDYFLFDSGLAAQDLMLQATAMGLIAHPIAGYSPEKISQIFEIPQRFVVIALVVLGSPGSIDVLEPKDRESERSPRLRQPIDEVVGWNRFVEG